MRARGGRAGRRCSRGRGVRQDALRDPVCPCSLAASCNLQARFVRSWSLAQSLLFFSWSARVQGRVDPEGGAEDGRRRREEVGRLGARGERRRRAGELLWGWFFPPWRSKFPLFLKLLFCHTTAIFQNPYDNFCAILVHRSRIFCSENSVSCTSDKLSARVPCSGAQMTCRFPLC